MLVAGQTIGEYRILGSLGQTAWATTYVAYGEDDEGVYEVALKIATETSSPASLFASLQTLTETMHALDRDDAAGLVVDAIEVGHDEVESQPLTFVVTPLSTHPSLADLIDVSVLAIDEAVALANNIAAALEPLHAKGIAHLAIKPTNLFVGPPPSHVVRIVDFGTADILRRASDREANNPWLAPEQLESSEERTAAGSLAGDGDASEASEVQNRVCSTQSDVYAMALVVFFALTGHRYWTSDAEMTKKERVLPSLRARDVAEVTIPKSIDGVLLRALDAVPDSRFLNARAFADAFAAAATAGDSQGETLGPVSPFAPSSSDSSLANANAAKGSLPSSRHLKATKKLVRFELPDRPTKTVKIDKFDLARHAKPAGGDARGRTQRLAPARMPLTSSSPPPSAENRVPISVAPRSYVRFDLPATSAPQQTTTAGAARIAIGLGVLILVAMIVIIVLLIVR